MNLDTLRFKRWQVVGVVSLLVIASVACNVGAGPTVAPQPSPAAIQPATPEEAPAQGTAPAESQAEPTAAPPAGGPMEGDEPLVARVNGQPIFTRTYEKQVIQFEQALISQGYDLNSADGQETLNQIRAQVLEVLIDQALIAQAATVQGIAISDEELAQKVQETIALGQGQQQFEEWLAASNLTFEEFTESLRDELLTSRLREQITAGAPTTAEQVHARHILVGDESTAQEVLAQLNAGASFADLAQTYSQDESTRPNGGDLGWFPRGLQFIAPEIEEAAFQLQPGQTSGIIRSQFGYHLIKVENREAARPLTPEMLQAIKLNLFSDWLAQQKAAATIERYLEF
ncbi:MAG: peptidylprolyl isomerase [Anaerolineae bacterium]